MQVTISLLPTSLSLVHIPRSRLAQLTHPVLHHILQPTQTFLNMTCNEIEMSLFVERGELAEFERVARKDRQRRRGSQGSSAGGPAWECVEISYEKWSVLQIDSHSDQLGELPTVFLPLLTQYPQTSLVHELTNSLARWRRLEFRFYISPRT